MLADLKFAFRQWVKAPGFMLIVVLTLALGTGANTAIFTVLNSAMLSALPVKDPQRLVFLTDPDDHGFHTGVNSGNRSLLTYPEFQYLRDHNTVFSGVLAVEAQTHALPIKIVGGDSSDYGRVSLVSGDYFRVLGVETAMGRTFGAETDKSRDASPVAVISFAFWQSRFGGRQDVLGKVIQIQNTTYDVIGVLPRSFSGETVGVSPAVWIPLTMQSEVLPGNDYLTPETNPLAKEMWLQVIARLNPDATSRKAEAGANTVFTQYLQGQIFSGVPEAARKVFLSQHLGLRTASRGGSTLDGYSAPLVILTVLVGLLLLIACANVANLVLARTTFRQKEISIRVALGASRGRIFRQLLTESVVLSLAGGGAGLLFAQWGDAALLQLTGLSVDVALSGRILAFTVATSMLVALLFGTAPALRAARTDLTAVLNAIAGRPARRGWFSFGKALVAGQIAVSILLLIVAGLFVHSLQKLAAADLGYDQRHLLIFNVDGEAAGYQGDAVPHLYETLADRLRAIPGVRGVEFASGGLLGGGDMGCAISAEGYIPAAGQQAGSYFDQIGAGYFSTLGIPVPFGREFENRDRANSHVVIVNQTFAHLYFGGTNPVGRGMTATMFGASHNYTIIGVAADIIYHNVREQPMPRFYVPFTEPLLKGGWNGNFAVRTDADPAAVIGSVRGAIKEAAPNLPAPYIMTMEEKSSQRLGLDRMLSKLSSAFGLLAAMLVSIGVYGIMSYVVARRSREIGIRMALGARRASVFWMVLSESLGLALAGLVIGIPAAIGAGRLISNMLYGLSPADPPVLAAVAAGVIALAMLAAGLPARRATKVDPVIALRAE